MAKRQITDEEDRLKRQARRRLIGAVALTTAVVVILPMVLDSEPKPAGQNIELKIPDKDQAGAFAPKIDLPPVSAPVSVPASAPVVASAPPAVAVSAVPPAPASAVAAAPVAAATPETKNAPPVQAAPAKPVPPPAKAAAPAPAETKPSPLPVQPSPAKESKPAPAQHESKPAPAKHDAKAVALTEQGQPAPQSGFIVQIGAFNNPDTAHSWQKNLKTQGFKAYTEKLDSKTRVRIGPYATHEEANAVRRKLEKTQGLHSNIIKLN